MSKKPTSIGCTVFPNCKTLTERMHKSTYALYANIRQYNNYVDRYNISHTETPLEKISPSKNYSESELDDIQKKLHDYGVRKLNDPNFARQEVKSFAESYGGSTEAYAIHAIENSELNNGEINDVVTDIARTFIDILLQIHEKTRDTNGNMVSITKLIRKRHPSFFFDAVRLKFKNEYDKSKKILINSRSDASLYSDAEIDSAQKTYDLCSKFMTEYSFLFNELAIMSLSLINQMLDTRINTDFVLENPVRAEEIANVEDMEEPTVEHWYDILDHRAPESSISKIIKRTLLLSPKVVPVVKTKYFVNVKDQNGKTTVKEVSKEDLETLPEDQYRTLRQQTEFDTKTELTTITKSPYPSNPNSEARRLFETLQLATDEEDMMTILKNNDYYKSSPLVTELMKDSRLRTTFFVDFNKYFQEMNYVQYKTNPDGTITASTPSLNTDEHYSIFDRFKSKLLFGDLTDNTFFKTEIAKKNDKETQKTILLDKNNIRVDYRLFSIAKDNFYKRFVPKDNNISLFDESKGTSQRSNMLIDILGSLNISIDVDTLSNIVNNDNKSNFIVKQLKTFFDYLSEKDLFNPSSHPQEAKNVITTIFNHENLREPIIKILSTITPKSGYNNSGKNMVKYLGSSLTSRIMPSGWVNFIKKVNSYGKEQLIDFIESRYKTSVNFHDGSKYLNQWISDIVDSADSEAGGFDTRNMFGITRCLGVDNKRFEDISSREHMLSILFSYLQHRNFYYENRIEDAKIIDGKLYTKDNDGDYSIEVNSDDTIGKTYRIINQGNKYRTYNVQKTVQGKPVLDKNNKIKVGFEEKSQFEVNDFAMIPMFITGDTNQLRIFRTPHYTQEQILDGIYNLYLSDQMVQETIKCFNDLGLSVSSNGKESLTKTGNSEKFGILSFLNDKKFLSRDDVKDIIGISDISSLSEDQVKSIAKIAIESEFEDFYTKIGNLGCLERIDGKYKYFDYLVSSLDGSELQTERLRNYFMQFFYDYKFGLYNQIHLAHVTELAFNGTEDMQKRNKAIATNGTPLSSSAEINGKKIFDNFSQSVVYFKDVKSKIDNDTMRKIAEFVRNEYGKTHSNEQTRAMIKFFIDKFKENTLTDGQAYRLFDSYRNVLAAAGENFWSNEQEDAYNRINAIIKPAREENRNLTIEEIQEVESLKVVMQPIKPINDGIETRTFKNGDKEYGVSISFQFKYAEVPLIPELYPVGSKLREIGSWMYKNNIDMICSDKCLKKGSFGEIDIQYKTVNGQYVDKNGDVIPGYDQDLNIVEDPTMAEQRRYIESTKTDNRVEYGDETSFEEIIENQTNRKSRDFGYQIHVIPFDNYLIQNNIPDHSDGKVVYGTQPRKIVGSMIQDGETYNFNIGGRNVSVNGDKLIKVWNMLHTAKYMKSFEQFMSLINDPKRLNRNLSFLIRNNDRTNLATLSKIALNENGDPMIPYSECGNQHDIINNIVSIFKKIVIRQEIYGGNIVQASALGCGKTAIASPDLNATFDEEGTLTGMEIEIPFIFQTRDKDGNIIKLKYEDWCNNDGSFITDEHGVPLIEKKYPGILDFTIIRIPTEGPYSMYHVRVKRCNPKTGANTIKMPLICTKISDFDFDIDKMFMHMREFVESFDEKEILDENGNVVSIDSKIWDDIYNENPDIKLRLYAAAGYKYKDKDYKVAGVKPATNEQKQDLAVKYHTTVDKLHLNYFWELAGIKEDKQDVYDRFYERYADRTKSTAVGSTFDFGNDDSSLLDLSLTAIDNAIVDIEQAVLSHKSTMIDRITPGGFDIMKEDGRMIRLLSHPEAVPGFEDGIKTQKDYDRFIEVITENTSLDYKESFDYSDPITQILYKQWNQIAGQEIGVFANDNVNDAISKRLKELTIKNNDDAILFGSLIDQQAEIDGVMQHNAKLGLNFLFNQVNGRILSKALHELLGSSVDAVKDNALVSLGLNGVTGDIGAMLVRLGYKTFDLGLLFNQPIVKDACEYMARSGEKNFSNAIKICIRRYVRENVDPNSIFKKPINKDHLTSFSLAKNLSDVNNQTQVEVGKLIVNKIAGTKQELSNYVQNTRNTSANTVTTDFGDFLSKAFKHERYLDKDPNDKKISIVANSITENGGYPITEDYKNWSMSDIHKNIVEFMNKYTDHPFTYENAVYNIIQFAMNEMMHKFTPFGSSLYGQHRNALNEYIAPWGSDGQHINELHAYIPCLILSDLDGDFNPSSRNNPLGIPNKEYYLKQIIEIIDDDSLNEDDDFGKFFIKYFDVASIRNGKEGVENSADFIKLKNISGANSLEKFEITKSISDIVRKGPKFANAIKAIYLHNYYIRGLNPSSNQLMEVAPIDVLKMLVADSTLNISYLDMFTEDGNQRFLDSVAGKVKSNVLKYIIYHSDDTSLVPIIPGRKSDMAVDDKTIIITGYNVKKCYLGKVGDGQSKTAYYRPIIKVDGTLYALTSGDSKEFFIGDEINNQLQSNVKTLHYTEVQSYKYIDSETAQKEDQYRPYYSEYNNFIFENYKIATPVDAEESTDSDESDTYDEGTSTGQQAADNVDTSKNIVDDEGNEACQI